MFYAWIDDVLWNPWRLWLSTLRQPSTRTVWGNYYWSIILILLICVCYGININLCDTFDIMNICYCDTPTCYKFAFVLEFLPGSLKLASYFCSKTGYMLIHRALLSTLCTSYVAFSSCIPHDLRVTRFRCNIFEQHGNSLLNLSVCNRKQNIVI